MGTAWEAQKNQPFGKDNLEQVYTVPPEFLHIVLPVMKSGFLSPRDLRKLCKSHAPIRHLHQEHERVKNIDWRPLCQPNPNWQDQPHIDDSRVDMRMAMLFHYNMDLAAVHRRTGGNHVGSHRNVPAIITKVRDLLDPKLLSDLERILVDGCPAKFNVEGTNQEFHERRAYGNHPSIKKNMEKVMATMNKEDRKEHVLTLPAWLAPFIPHLMLSPNGLIIKFGKNDRLVFDASYMLHERSTAFNLYIDLSDEPDIVFGDAWNKFLTAIHNLRITFPNIEIYLFDDDVASAFRQLKYHPNVLSAKGFIIDKYLFLPTGLTFGDASSPPSFEPLARARMALSTELSKGDQPVPAFSEYLDKVKFTAPPPPDFPFARARADLYNPGVPLPPRGTMPSVVYNMHVDDNLYAAAGKEHMQWAMRCSIAGLQGILGDNEPALRACQPDLEKFLAQDVSYCRRQLGYVINTRSMMVTIPEDKRCDFLQLLQSKWGPQRVSFLLSEAAELLGIFVYLCRVCHWGPFLFQNLYHAMSHALTRNAQRLWHSPEFRQLVALRDQTSRHPTDASKFRFFSKKVSRAIYDAKSRTYISPDIRDEIAFITEVFSRPDVYQWESPICHLIKREPDGEAYQDACPRGAGGFSDQHHFDFWWTVVWPDEIFNRTQLSPSNPSYISNNLLEYAALLFGLAAVIVSWELLPESTRPPHPFVLLWSDNTTAKAWSKKISGIKNPQGRSLARILAHLLMFSQVGIETDYVIGEENIVADFLSRAPATHGFANFSYRHLQTRFPWLHLSRRFLPSNELLALVCSALLQPSVNIPTTRVPLGRMTTESSISSPTFFGLPS
jgi:hypothetical protein